MEDIFLSMYINLEGATPETEASATLTPGTERGDILTPVIEMNGFKTSVDELPRDGVPTNQAPANGHTTTADQTPAYDIDYVNSIAPQRSLAKILIDRQNRHIATMLTRFAQLIKVAMAPEEDGATLENQASLSLQLEVEWQALVSVRFCNVNERLIMIHRSKKPKICSS